jgi:hypothetical protein
MYRKNRKMLFGAPKKKKKC